MEEKEIIPNGWTRTHIENLIKEKSKSKIQVGDVSNFGEYLFFTSGDEILRHTDYLIDGEQIYLATGGVANVKYYNGKAAYSTDTYVLSTNEKIQTKYLYYKLDFLNFYINANYFLGSGLKHLQKKDFKKHEIIFPTSLDEQKAIADLLSKIDGAIEKTKCLIKKYTDIKIGLMHDLLSCGIDKNGKLRSEKTHQFKDSPLGKIPKEWDVVELGKVAESIADGDHMPPPKVETGIPFITITNLTNDNKIDFSSTMFVPLWYYENLDDKRKPKKNDILYSVVGSLGIPVLVSGDSQFVFQRHIAIIRPNLKEIIPDFLYTMMSSFSFFIQADFAAVGIAQRTISLSSLKKLSFAKPDISEQKEILNRLEPITKLIQSEQKTLENLIAQKQGLMKDLLTGRVRVKI